jgi:predicted RNA-binding Zn ribbon-like protein
VERLPDRDALLAWVDAAGVVSAEEAATLATRPPAALAAELRRVHELREATHGMLDAYVDRRPPPPAAAAAVHRTYAAAVAAARPSTTLPMTWDVDVAGRQPERAVGHRLALAVAGLLASPDLSLLGRCGNEPCGWLFVDRTRNRTRRYCSSAGCGNSERARRHYARHHGRPDGPKPVRDTST